MYSHFQPTAIIYLPASKVNDDLQRQLRRVLEARKFRRALICTDDADMVGGYMWTLEDLGGSQHGISKSQLGVSTLLSRCFNFCVLLVGKPPSFENE